MKTGCSRTTVQTAVLDINKFRIQGDKKITERKKIQEDRTLLAFFLILL